MKSLEVKLKKIIIRLDSIWRDCNDGVGELQFPLEVEIYQCKYSFENLEELDVLIFNMEKLFLNLAAQNQWEGDNWENEFGWKINDRKIKQ